MATPTDLQLILGHQRATRQVRDRIENYVRTIWTNLGSYRDQDIDRMVRMVVPMVEAGQLQIANLTDSYLSRLAGTTGRGADGDPVTGGAVRTGTVPDEVYRRPAVQTYTALSQGSTFEQAVGLGLQRIVSLAVTDLQLAKRAQEQVTMTNFGFEYYRRVLTGLENCAKCAIASTQRYRVGDLKPIHPGCDCDVAPEVAGSDPGQVLNGRLLESLHDQIYTEIGQRDRGALDLGLGKTDSQGRPLSDFTELVVVHQHGEYGPTLAWRGDHFTGPDDLAA